MTRLAGTGETSVPVAVAVSEADVLRQEVERLEQEIDDLTEFSPGSAFGEQAESG